MPHWFDKPLRVQSMDRFRGVAGICMKMLPPSSCGMPLVTAAWCGFLRDGIEGRWEREAGVGRLLAWKDVFGETQETGAAGCSIPLPVSPLPTGAIPHRYGAMEEAGSYRSHLTLPEDPVSSPCTAIRGYRQTLPAPSRRGRQEALMSGREVGVFHEYRSTRDAGDRGGSGQS